MADNKVEIKVTADTAQAVQGVTAIENNIRALAGTLDGELKAKALASADALAQLGTKKEAIDSFKSLLTETRKLGSAMDEASQKVDKLGADLPKASAATKALAAAQTAAAGEVQAAKSVLDEQRTALGKLNADYKAGTVSSTDYKEANAQLKSTITDLRENLTQKKTALTAANQAVAASAAAEKELTKEYASAIGEAAKLSAAVGNKSRELDKSRSALKAAGVETNGLADTERKLKTEIAAATSEAQKLVPVLAQAAQKTKDLDDGAKQAGQSAGGMGKIFSELGPIIGAAFTGREFVQTIVSAESLKLGLTAILGSSQAAAAELDFLKKTSNDLGLELQSAGRQYLSLTAATKGTNLEGEQTRAIFTAVSRAMSVLGKSSAETERALNAVSQMASKGTVSMEELRGQLGEALPGALQAAADGAGITVSQLIKMVETGEVLAKDLLPALTKGLDAVYAKGGPPDSLIANWNRLKNTITETSVELGESGLTKALTDVAVVGTKTVGTLGSGFVGLGKGIGQVAGAVATLNFKPLAEDLGLTNRAVADFEELTYDAMGNLIGQVQKAQPAVAGLTTEIKSSGTAAEDAGNKSAEAFRKSEIAARNSSASVLQNKQMYTDREEAIKRSLEVAERGVKASESEAKVINLVASAFGSETEKRQASLLASQLQQQAQNQLILVKREELDIATQKLAQLVNETRGIKDLDEATKKQKQELEQSVKVKTEEVRVTEAQGKAYEITAKQLVAAGEAFKDNSSRVYELRAAMVAATEAAARKREELAKGKATQEQVTAADLAAKNATYLYRDALNDLVTALKLKETAMEQQGVTQQKQIDLNIEQRTTVLELAKVKGDETAIDRAQQAVTQAKLAGQRELANSQRAQAQAIRETADAEENAAKASGALTTEKRAQIDAMRESAKQKELDADKTDLLTNREVALARATSGTTDSINANTSALERKNAAIERANSAQEKSIELENKRLNRDKEGFSLNTAGQRVSMDVQNQRSVYENAKGQGLTEAQALQISNQFIDSAGRQKGFGGANSAAGENWGTMLQKAIDTLVLQNAGAGAISPPAFNRPAPAPATTQTYLVKVELPSGQGGSFKAASDNDARAATQLIQQLASAKAAAGF